MRYLPALGGDAFIPETQNPQKSSPHPHPSPQLAVLTDEIGPRGKQGWRVAVASLGCQSPGGQQDRGFRGSKCWRTLPHRGGAFIL